MKQNMQERSLSKFFEQLGISIAFRITDAMNDDSQDAGERLEAEFKAIASFSWAQGNNLAQQLVESIRGCSEERWCRGVTECLAIAAELNSEVIKREHPDHPDISDWCQTCQARAFLTVFTVRIGHGESVGEFAAWIREYFLELLAKGSQGHISNLWLDGIFTRDLAESREKISELLFAIGGEELIHEVSLVARKVRKELLGDPATRLVLGLIEGFAKITMGDASTGADLESIVQRACRRLRNLGLTLPGSSHEVSILTGKRTYSYEKLLIEASITDNLLKRVQSDPDCLMRDALDRKLSPWLLAAAGHDLLDQIDFLRADKRDVTKEVSLDAPLQNGGNNGDDEDERETLLDVLPSSSPDPAELAVSADTIERFMALLTPLEKEIVDLTLNGLNTSQLAKHYGRDFKWAEARLKAIGSKLIASRQREE
jgi:hypothetical protein